MTTTTTTSNTAGRTAFSRPPPLQFEGRGRRMKKTRRRLSRQQQQQQPEEGRSCHRRHHYDHHHHHHHHHRATVVLVYYVVVISLYCLVINTSPCIGFSLWFPDSPPASSSSSSSWSSPWSGAPISPSSSICFESWLFSSSCASRGGSSYSSVDHQYHHHHHHHYRSGSGGCAASLASSVALGGMLSSWSCCSLSSSCSSALCMAPYNYGDDNYYYSNSDDDDPEEEDFRYHTSKSHVRTDVLIFLTQRAIQSFVFLLINCRDPHTVHWLEEQLSFHNLENYHGTGAFNLTKYDTSLSILVDMMNQPNDVIVVSAKRRGRGHGGWSLHNPHLEERFVEFEINIDPPSLVSRIMSVRDQISKEWIEDLNTIVVANDMIIQSYQERNQQERDQEECGIRDDDYDDDISNAGGMTDYDCHDSESLGSSSTTSTIMGSSGGGVASSSSSSNSNSDYARTTNAFLRNSMMMISNSIDFNEGSSSPYRKGNFDLLCLLVTQESVHRTLREYRIAPIGEERIISYIWLREFYIQRVNMYFDGSQPYGRAEDFIDDILATPPSMKILDDDDHHHNDDNHDNDNNKNDINRNDHDSSDHNFINKNDHHFSVGDVDGNNYGNAAGTKKKIGLIDPLRIAEDIIRWRSIVAMEWKQRIKNDVYQEHVELRKLLWTKQMEKYNANTEDHDNNDNDDGGTTNTPSSSRISQFE